MMGSLVVWRSPPIHMQAWQSWADSQVVFPVCRSVRLRRSLAETALQGLVLYYICTNSTYPVRPVCGTVPACLPIVATNRLAIPYRRPEQATSPLTRENRTLLPSQKVNAYITFSFCQSRLYL